MGMVPVATVDAKVSPPPDWTVNVSRLLSALSVTYTAPLAGSAVIPVGFDPAAMVKGLPVTGVSPLTAWVLPLEELAIANPESVPEDGQVAGSVGTVPVTGGEVVTTMALVFVTYR